MRQLLALLVILAISMAGVESARPDGSPQRTNHTRIVVHKAGQILEFHEKGRSPMIFRVCLGMNPEGPKKITGDQRTPEGEYFICLKSAASSFHRFLGISYPGERDAQAAFEQGVISLDTRDSIIQSLREGRQPPWNTKLGGWVGIHGYPTDNYRKLWITLLFPKPHNWTDGCIALWDFEIDQIFPKVSLGAPVTIFP